MRRILLLTALLIALGATLATAQSMPPSPMVASGPVSGPADDPDATDLEVDDLFTWFAGDEERAWVEGADAAGAEPRRAGPAVRRGMPGPRGPFAPGLRPGMRRGALMRRTRGLAALELTEAQRAQMRELHTAHRREAIRRRAELEISRLDLHALLRAASPQRGAIDAQIDKLSRLEAEQHKARVHTMLAVRAVLTPAQQQQWRERREQRPGARFERGERSPAAPGVRRRDGTIDRSGRGSS